VIDYRYCNGTDNSIAPFLEMLNSRAVLDALMDFDGVMKDPQGDSSQTGQLCGTIISALDDKKEAAETAAALPEFWQKVPEFDHHVLHHAVKTRVSKGLLMLSCMKAYEWVASITTTAVKERANPNCWVYQLARDVKTEWHYRNNNPEQPKNAIFHSHDYLPSLTSQCDATVELRRWGIIDRDQQEDKIIQAVSTIIEAWLQFPTSKDNKRTDKLRCTLLSIVTKYMPFAVLLLDPIWSMFLQPYQSLIHGRTHQRVTRRHTEETIRLFEECIQKHPMTNTHSHEYLLLTSLTQQSDSWFQERAHKESQETGPVYENVRMI
jgi:hypothetical protein